MQHIVPDMIMLNCDYAVHNADWNWDNIFSPFARLYVVLNGEATIIVSNKEYNVKQGSIYLIPPYTRFSCRCIGEFELYYFHIYENPTSKVFFFEEYVLPVEVASSDFEIDIAKKILDINPQYGLSNINPDVYDNQRNVVFNIKKRQAEDFYNIVVTRGAINILLAPFVKCAKAKNQDLDDRVSLMISHINRHIDSDIKVAELADLCLLSENHTMRIFKSQIGLSIIDYINKRRIERAQILLITTAMSVKDIAYSLGFENVSYFNRLFLKRIGVTPRKYKLSHQQ